MKGGRRLTNEKAIKILKRKMDGSVDTSYEWAETVRMAIDALRAQPEKTQHSEEDTTSDCISRKEAIESVSRMMHDCFGSGD